MPSALTHRTAGGGPLMTVLALLIFLLPVLTLGGWLRFTPEGRASWMEAQQQVATEAAANQRIANP